MGLFGLFGKKKKEKYTAIAANEVKNNPHEEFLKPEKKAEPKKEDEKKAVKPETKPEDKKPEAKTTEKKATKDTTVKSEEKKATPKADVKPEEKKTAQKPKSTPTETAIEAPLETEIESAETLTESKLTRNGNFEIKKAKDGRFFFNLCASNKVVIAYSQIYSSSTSAVNGIKSVIANAPKASIEDTTLKNPTAQPFPKWEIYVDKAGKHRFRLYAQNGSCVCHSARGYATKATCKGGIESIISFAVEDADVSKSYLK